MNFALLSLTLKAELRVDGHVSSSGDVTAHITAHIMNLLLNEITIDLFT